MSEDSTISCYDDHAKDYDEYQLAIVPHYQDALEATADACERYLRKDPAILDIGCGTGNVCMAVLGRMKAEVFLLDGSQSMVEIASKKIATAYPGTIIGCKIADLSEDDWSDGLGRYDAVISTLVLEHIPPDKYRSLISRCLDLLNPGGVMASVEGYDEGDDMLGWFNGLMEQRKSRVEPEVAESVASLRDEHEIQYYTSKARKTEWWREAGFMDVKIIWQYLAVALMVGRKSEEKT